MKNIRSGDRALSGAVLVLLGTLAMMWPAIANRRPLLFYDTTAYVRAADGVMARAGASRTGWSDELAGPVAEPVPTRPVLAGRSVYYGGLLWGGFWPAALAQSLLTAVCVLLAIRRLRPDDAPLPPCWTGLALILLAVATPAAFFASYMMPDIFAPMAVMSVAMLAAPSRRSSRLEDGFWFAVLSAACLFHSANLLIVGVLLTLTAAAGLMRFFRVRRVGSLLAAASLAIGAAGEIAFDMAVERSLGSPPIRPPFVTARLIEDGPGLRYLRKACAARPTPFQVCRHLPKLPQPSDAFLWSEDERIGVFMAAPPAEQRALSAEQGRFAAAVLMDRPVEQLMASIAATGRQLSMFGLPEFNYDDQLRAALVEKLPPEELARQRGTLAFRSLMPVRIVESMTPVAMLASLVVVALALGRRSEPAASARGVREIAAIVLGGVLVNAAVCGALSGAHHRYGARVVWLVPLLALCLAPHLWRPSRRRTRSGFAVRAG